MTRTENYNLPQWAAHDPVRREDFNGAFAALDRAYTPDHKPYATGSYAGDGTESQDIELGFRPQFLIIASINPGPGARDSIMSYSIMVGGHEGSVRVSFTDTGFTVAQSSNYPKMNESIRTYYYIAFR